MSNSESRTDKIINWSKNNRVSTTLIIIFIIITGLGTVLSAITSIDTFVNTFIIKKEDPYTFNFKNQLIKFSGGNGISIEQAIIIEGALTSDAGMGAEYNWIERFYPNHELVLRATLKPNEDSPPFYDVFTFKSSAGLTKELYFDITSFYGTPLSNSKLNNEVEKYLKENVLDVLENHTSKGTIVIEVPAHEFKL